MEQSITDFDVFQKNQSGYLTTYVRDPATEDLVNVAGSSTFSLTDISDDSVVYSTTFSTDGGTGINHAGTGIYQFLFDASTYPNEYIANFRCTLDGEIINNRIFIKSIESQAFARAAELRVQVDKARKSISDDIENMDRPQNEPAVRFFFGYDDKHLIYYLERGIQFINLVPPYTALSVPTFPWANFGYIATDAGVIAALESQGIFAIDTDYNYSLGGNSLVIDHFTKINALLGTLIGRFDTNVLRFKQQYRSKGTVMFQWMPGGVRAARQLSAMPSGFWSRLLSSAFA